MEAHREFSYRTKRRRISAAVSKLLDEIESHVDDAGISNTENPLSCQTSMHANITSITDNKIAGRVVPHSSQCNLFGVTCDEVDEPHSNVCAHDDNSKIELDVFSSDELPLSYIDSDVPDDCTEWQPNAVSSEDEAGEDDTCDAELSAKEKLAEWAVNFNISHCALGTLLGILHTCDGSEMNNLPKDARSLLSCRRNITVVQRAGGDYYYFGVRYWLSVLLEMFLQRSEIHDSRINLIVNIDGIPLFNSSNVALWPILGSVAGVHSCPFPIAVFCSRSKPACLDEYLADFIAEMSSLESDGFCYNDRQFSVCLYAVVCDAPARAFLKCIKTHSGYDSCERCCQHGEWHGKVIFPGMVADLRTDLNFANKDYPNHHLNDTKSPLLQLKSLGLVTQFPLDYMHLVCLGVTRRLLSIWFNGPRSTKLSRTHIALLSDKLVKFNKHIPREFARKPRAADEYKNWKATELRLFLLYTGPVVLKGILPNNLYEHFLTLSVAIRILLCDQLLEHYLQYAADLLRYFVRLFGDIYGKDQLVYNVHSLIHLADDAKKYGTLDHISAFQFESYLGRLKKLVRRPQQPCVQVVRRVLEGHCKPKLMNSAETSFVAFKGPHMDGPLPFSHIHCPQFKQYICMNASCEFMSVNTGDNCFEIKGRVGLIRNILKEVHNDICPGYVVFEEFTDQNAFFTQPLDSQTLHVFLVEKLSGVHEVISLCNDMRKHVLLPHKHGYVAVPQMHKS